MAKQFVSDCFRLQNECNDSGSWSRDHFRKTNWYLVVNNYVTSASAG